MRRVISLGLLLCVWTAPSARAADSGSDTRSALESIVAGDHRTDEERARDRYRNPVETLLWLGIGADFTVVELAPGGGWYLKIIAPLVRESGAYYAANGDAETWWPRSRLPYVQSRADRLRNHLGDHPDLFDHVRMSVLSEGLAPDGSADLVLTFRNVHGWMRAATVADVFASAYAALKPGGIFGVVQHRGDANQPQDPEASTGYVREDAVIRIASEAGFELVDRTDLNRNPRDTKDYAEGVWTLPPTLRLGDRDREKYLAIGESDRMTLKFRKPTS